MFVDTVNLQRFCFKKTLIFIKINSETILLEKKGIFLIVSSILWNLNRGKHMQYLNNSGVFTGIVVNHNPVWQEAS